MTHQKGVKSGAKTHTPSRTRKRRRWPRYVFTFGVKRCVIKTYVQIEIGGEPGYIAFTFVVENDGQSLRPIGDHEGQVLSFFAQTEDGVLAQASHGLERRFCGAHGV